MTNSEANRAIEEHFGIKNTPEYEYLSRENEQEIMIIDAELYKLLSGKRLGYYLSMEESKYLIQKWFWEARIWFFDNKKRKL